MEIREFFTPGLAIHSYLIYDEETKCAALIDPTCHIEPYLSQAIQDKVEITDIIETHVHADFVSGAIDLKAALNNKPTIHCSGMAGKSWIPACADLIVYDHAEIKLGSVRLEARHTPGHTPEHLIWLAFDEKRSKTLPEVAFTGDLLFVGSVGRPDLFDQQESEILAKQLYHTLFQIIDLLPDFLEILPSHGAGSLCGKAIGARASSTIGYEKRCNPALAPQEFHKWKEALLKDIPAFPEYFKRVKNINLVRTEFIPPEQKIIQISPDRVKEIGAFIVDLRSPDAFSQGHLKGAVNIPLTSHFPSWAGSVIPDDKEITLIVNTFSEAFPAMQYLKLIGITSIKGVCEAKQVSSTESRPTLSVEELKAAVHDYYILDVRTPHEWFDGHIFTAHHLELCTISTHLEILPRDRPIAVICRSGTRASIAASLLISHGFDKTFNVRGGMQAWNASMDTKIKR
jgi:hydroxyacylglutathione hydrolase